MIKEKKQRKVRNQSSLLRRAGTDLKRNYVLYIMIIPVVAFYILFCYKPMYGALIAFKDFSPRIGIMDSPWVGLKYFKRFFQTADCWRAVKNTLIISISSMIFACPAPIILALLFNELKSKKLKSLAQSVSYLPHFISLVVVCGMISTFVSKGGIIHQLVTMFSDNKVGLLSRPELFVPIYVLSGIWQGVGWNSIIYLAALSAIDTDLYEAAKIDGANRWKQMLHVTLPGILPTIIILMILQVGSLFSLGHEKIILLYNELTYDTADVIASYVYRMGLQQQNWSFSSAVGLMNSAINFILVVTVNKLSAKYSETSLW